MRQSSAPNPPSQSAEGSCALRLDLSSGSSTTSSIPLWTYIQKPFPVYNLTQVANVGGYHVEINVTNQGGGLTYIENLPPGQSRPFSGTQQLSLARCHDNNACYLEYERADNGWAAYDRPDGDLGKEYVLVPAGETKTFITDWKYEKRRGNAGTYYGSHLRRAKNNGVRPIRAQVRTSPVSESWETLKSGLPRSFRADLVKVQCTLTMDEIRAR